MTQSHLMKFRGLKVLAYALGIGFVGAMVSAAPGSAAPDNFCHAYSKLAVAQNGKNQNLGCGYSGPRWQSNEAAHFIFCKIANENFLDSESATRAEMLAVCEQNAAPAPGQGQQGQGQQGQGQPQGQGVPPPVRHFESVYSTLDLAQCRQEPPVPGDPLMGAVWWCVGYDNIPVRVAEGDLRYLVSFGDKAAFEPAAGQTLPQFNRIGTTLEWRLEWDAAAARWVPIATILRYFTEGNAAAEGQVLVVTKLGGPEQICHVGYVDALRNPNANVIAREIAETLAPGFDCSRNQAGYHGVAP